MPINFLDIRRLWQWFQTKIYRNDSEYKKLFRIYFLVIIAGSVLLFLPVSLNYTSFSGGSYSLSNNKTYTFFDALFLSISSFTNTGLSTQDVSVAFSTFGKIIILLLIQIGGLGFLTVLIVLWKILIKHEKFSVENRFLLHFEKGGSRKNESFPIVKTGMYFLLTTELIGAILLSFFFYYVTPSSTQGASSSTTNGVTGDVAKSIWFGVFHSISGSNNAGFDILGKDSIVPYRNDSGNILSVILLIQSFIGGIGYPVFYDIKCWIKNRRKNQKYKITLFTKISLLMYLLISYVSTMSIILLEATNSYSFLYAGSGDWGTHSFANKLWNAVYLTFSARSAGFAGMKMSLLSDKSQWLLTVLMFVGASPASTGGGIRSITLFLIVMKIFQMTSGRRHVSAFKRTIEQDTLDESMIVFLFAIFLLFGCSMIIPASNLKMSDIFFECASAFGTAGLTTTLTSQTNLFGKTVLLALMFIGQLGITNSLLFWKKMIPDKKNIQFLKERVRII